MHELKCAFMKQGNTKIVNTCCEALNINEFANDHLR